MILPGTIAAIASPPGRSARAVLRLSGPDTGAALGPLIGATPTSHAAPCRLRLTPALDLPCLVLWFTAPRSYTGEDAAEIQIPGNPSLAERVLGLLISTPGVRLARPGEFTARAFLNGRLSLQQGEAVGSLIAAQNADELAAARALASGRTGELHRRWAEEITTLLALVEAGIDFTDQEGVVAIEPGALADRIAALLDAMQSHLGAAAGVEAHDTLPTVVLAGAPNAGKSTLFNTLLGRRRAVESPTAGTTRDALRETLDLSRDAAGAGPVTLIDLAGIDGGAHGMVDHAAQSLARTEIARADVVVYCDPSGRFTPLETRPREGITPTPVIKVRTKADLPAAPGAMPTGTIAVCALDGWNLRALRHALADHARGAVGASRSTMPARHARALGAARDSLQNTLALTPDSRRRPELVAARLREAADAMSELVGRISADDVLGRVFSTFCVGK